MFNIGTCIELLPKKVPKLVCCAVENREYWKNGRIGEAVQCQVMSTVTGAKPQLIRDPCHRCNRHECTLVSMCPRKNSVHPHFWGARQSLHGTSTDGSCRAPVLNQYHLCNVLRDSVTGPGQLIRRVTADLRISIFKLISKLTCKR